LDLESVSGTGKIQVKPYTPSTAGELKRIPQDKSITLVDCQGRLCHLLTPFTTKVCAGERIFVRLFLTLIIKKRKSEKYLAGIGDKLLIRTDI
jgi:hypothetical protein